MSKEYSAAYFIGQGNKRPRALRFTEPVGDAYVLKPGAVRPWTAVLTMTLEPVGLRNPRWLTQCQSAVTPSAGQKMRWLQRS